jgi:hypothetical protein
MSWLRKNILSSSILKKVIAILNYLSVFLKKEMFLMEIKIELKVIIPGNKAH